MCWVELVNLSDWNRLYDWLFPRASIEDFRWILTTNLYSNFSMSSTCAYVPSLPCTRNTRCCISTRANEPIIPPTAVALFQRAARAARIYLEESPSNDCGEIEFPSVSKDDGSAAARDSEQKSHVQLALSISKEVGNSSMIVFNERTRRLIEAGGRPVSKYPNYARGGSVLIAVAPSAEEEWDFLEKLCKNEGRRVIIANGVFHNGLDWIEPIFYVRPCSGWGFLIREYPGDWKAVSARTGKALDDIEITLLSQGRLRRPDLPTASKALMRDFYA